MSNMLDVYRDMQHKFFLNTFEIQVDNGLESIVDWCLFFIILCFSVSIVTENYSQVDKLWSITPWFYTWVLVLKCDVPNARLLLMAIVSTIWGMRLSLNFYRRGGYKWPLWEGEEDYRWAIVRKYLDAESNIVLWQLFNFGFICFYQHVLLLLTAFPAYIVYQNPTIALTYFDYVLVCVSISLIMLEGVADEQQYNYQTEKYRRIKLNGKKKLTGIYKTGFIQSGLWSLCRHPNYACEQSIWIVYYCFSHAIVGWNYSMIGFFLLIMLFLPSSIFSESLSLEKYPEYANYQKTHCRFFPFGSLFSN